MKKKELVFKKVKKKYFTFIKKQEILGEPFYNKLKQLNFFYLPICDYIFKKFKNSKKTFIIGLSGGQGSGKSTIAQIIKIILKTKYKLNVINFSIDDYYKTSEERVKLSKIYSKLFITRGVPGTHDTKLLMSDIKKLKRKNFKQFSIPKFDKSIDDRMKKKNWIKIKKKPQIIIFEGWCIGARPQNNNSINKPINRLEKYYDVDLTWRKKV
ncbi:uridine kinase, partial [Pelagibacteraceae bacterium]|nr:uridine kinase [Pelagibacteraceae bacterium]